MSEFELRYDELKDPQFWKKLNPELTVSLGQRPISAPRLSFSQDVLESVKMSLKLDGYFQLDKVLDQGKMNKLANVVENIYKSGWPTPFALVYDEYWEIFHELHGLFESVLGGNFKQVPNFWCWYVDRTNESKGWGHHRDRPSCSTVDDDGMPQSITVWIPLTDATALNGCIYVVPKKYDRNFSGDRTIRSIDEYQDVKGLPAKSGSVLCWSESLLHWGSRSSAKASNPRVSISFTYQRSDQNAFESPLYPVDVYPSFEERLGLIVHNICNYAERSNASAAILSACRRACGIVPTITMQDGLPRELVDGEKRLSESALWRMQEEYYSSEGLGAWSENRVPFYPTNRMNFVETYVELFTAFIADSHSQLNFEEPLYVVELGSGTGCFAYRFLNELLDAKLDFEQLRRLKITYVVTDFAQSNIDNHLRNGQFKRFIEEGVLDFAVFRPDNDRSIHLTRAGLTLSQESLKNPLFVIANYFFDSIKQDAFRALHGALQECRFALFREPNPSTTEKPARLSEVKTIERFVDITTPYYGEPILDAILEHYRAHLDEASIFFPIGALKAVKNLCELSNQKLVLLSSDKGYTNLESRLIKGLRPYEIARHDNCISLEVNFDAIVRLLEGLGGKASVETGDRINLCTLFGTTMKHDLPQVNHYFRQTFQKRDFLNSSFNLEAPLFYADLENKPLYGTKLTLFLSIVKSYNYDPHIFGLAFERFYDVIENECPRLDKQHKKEIVELVGRTFRNLFAVSSSPAQLDAILRCYLSLKEMEECLSVSVQSFELFGVTRTALDHAALSCEQLDRRAEAYEYFRQSFEMSPEHSWAKEGMERNSMFASVETKAKLKGNSLLSWLPGMRS